MFDTPPLAIKVFLLIAPVNRVRTFCGSRPAPGTPVTRLAALHIIYKIALTPQIRFKRDVLPGGLAIAMALKATAPRE